MNMGEPDKVNILLVDDRPENLLALEAIIERDDYNLIKASSGEEALIHLLKYEFAVILLDVQMPGIDGYETAKIIKARERTKNIPIIFITANNLDSNNIFMGYSIGAIDYIMKPFDPFILKSKIDIFVEMFKINQKNIQQAHMLAEKTTELEKINEELSNLTFELRESEALANVINESSMDTMIVMDHNGIILKGNPAFERMFQFDVAEIVGENISVLFSNEKSKSYIDNVLEAISTIDDLFGYSNIKEIYATRKDRSHFIAEIQVGKRYVKNKYLVALTIRDITKKKQDQELITHMAYHDGLTNLPNRRLFNERLNSQLTKAKEQNHSLAILCLDIDRFKYINDSLGHYIGDRLLQEISTRLIESIGDEYFVSRIGGDEFNIILSNSNRENAIEIAETIIKGFSKPFNIDNYELFITTSVGISIFPYDGEDSLTLLKNSDAALYRAKEHGKNTYKIFHSGMNIHSYRSFILQNDLRKAIERNELTLYYQPRVDLETGKINSAEALLRWNHPNWGLISPLEFIPLAEESGQIVEIGEWVLEAACRQSKVWNDNGLHSIRVAVNFSPRQFLQKNLIEKIQTVLKDTGISTDMLEIEITESTLMDNEGTVINVLEQLRKMGITISIDDFGTGYSSLSYLKRLPVNTIKIDKSFIQDISSKFPSSVSFVSSLLSLGQSLNLSMIAEGVETEEQFNILKGQNCKEIQGFLICPPVPPREFEEFTLEKNSRKKISITDKDSPSEKVHVLHTLKESAVPFSQNAEIINLALYRTKETFSISSRELEVFQLIVEGLTNKEISDKLFISEHTVKNHITRILQKLNVSDRLQAMAIIYQTCLEESQNLRAK
jgi:diguanylate cyclase (GGDEF)-like protein/PAS domain S-box-containing protein